MTDPKQVLTSFAKAVCELVTQTDLAYADPGEEAITGKLASLMQPHFPDWTVVGQWDRREQDIKKLYYAGSKTVASVRNIRPDIIVHHVGKQENLLVVEAKRHINQNYADDIGKLEGMTASDGNYRYEVGAHLILNIPEAHVANCEVYIDGRLDAELTAWVRELLP